MISKSKQKRTTTTRVCTCYVCVYSLIFLGAEPTVSWQGQHLGKVNNKSAKRSVEDPWKGRSAWRKWTDKSAQFPSIFNMPVLFRLPWWSYLLFCIFIPRKQGTLWVLGKTRFKKKKSAKHHFELPVLKAPPLPFPVPFSSLSEGVETCPNTSCPKKAKKRVWSQVLRPGRDVTVLLRKPATRALKQTLFSRSWPRRSNLEARGNRGNRGAGDAFGGGECAIRWHQLFVLPARTDRACTVARPYGVFLAWPRLGVFSLPVLQK